MAARHYDPQTGRFLQVDPLGIEAAELYAYAANNPYAFWDPTGLKPLDIGGFDFGIGVAFGADANIGFDLATDGPSGNVSAAATIDIGQMLFVDARGARGPGDIRFDASSFLNLGGFARFGSAQITSPTFHPDRNFVNGPLPLPGGADNLGGFAGLGINVLVSTTSDPTAFSENLSRQGGFDLGLGPLGGVSLKVAGNDRGDLIFVFSGGPLSRGLGVSASEVPSTTFTPLRR